MNKKKDNPMLKKKWLVLSAIALVVVIGSIIYFYLFKLRPGSPDQAVLSDGAMSTSAGPGAGPEGVTAFSASGNAPTKLTRQPIRPANEVAQVKATGNIALQEQETVLSKVEALINKVHVKAGDTVAAGDILVTLDTQNLQREVEAARFDLSKAQADLKKLTDPPDPVKVTAARQKLLIAQEELDKVKAGPGAVELQTAETDVFAAWAKYNDLVAGKTDDELASERNALRQAERDLKRAQEDYDSISWRSNFKIGEERAKTLEAATNTYENAKAAYNKAVKPAEEKDVRSAYSEALKAQDKLAELRHKPTPKELAEAELKVSEAQQELDTLTGPADADKLTEAKMEVQKKELLLAEATAKLTSAELTAPLAGTVVSVDAQAGKTADVNDKMVTIANLQAFKLTVNVPEIKINRLHVGQAATITLDAVPDQSFPGRVSYISPINQSDQSGLVSYAVTVDLDIKDAAGLRAGMTAVVKFVDDALKNAWLVPTTSIQPDNSLTVYRNNTPITVTVKPGFPQGEWTVVQSPELQAGDEIEAGLSSFLDQPFPFGPAGGAVVVEER